MAEQLESVTVGDTTYERWTVRPPQPGYAPHPGKAGFVTAGSYESSGFSDAWDGPEAGKTFVRVYGWSSEKFRTLIARETKRRDLYGLADSAVNSLHPYPKEG